MARPKASLYIAVNEPFHYPAGVLLPGDAAVLSHEDARRGIDRGVLIEVTVLIDGEAVVTHLNKTEE